MDDDANQHIPAYHDLDDDQLVEQAKDGHFEAFEELVRRYQHKAYRLAFSLLKEEYEAQDAVQEAFLNAYRKLDTFRGGSQFGSWMYRIVVNACLMRLRRQRVRGEVSIEDLTPGQASHAESEHSLATSWQPRGDTELENRELRSQILAAIDKLEPKYQTVFLLREVEGLSLHEIGEVLDLTVAAVKSRLHRARLFLRSTLEPYLHPA